MGGVRECGGGWRAGAPGCNRAGRGMTERGGGRSGARGTGSTGASSRSRTLPPLPSCQLGMTVSHRDILSPVPAINTMTDRRTRARGDGPTAMQYGGPDLRDYCPH